MSTDILPQTTATLQFEQLASEDGIPVLLPTATIQALLTAGRHTLTVTVHFAPPQEGPQITVTEAVRLLVDALPGLEPGAAKSRVLRACETGKLTSRGERSTKRIDRTSFDAWLWAQVQADADAHEQL